MMAAASDDFEKEMNSIWWWHQIRINGYMTPGLVPDSREIFYKLNLPEDMSGMTVLDIGAWDGFYSFLCEKRGADVTANDKFVWEGVPVGNPDWYGRRRPSDAGFEFARKHLGSSVRKLVASVEELDPVVHGKFDVVLLLGVIYHATDPIGYLRKARDMSNGLVCVETHVDLMDLDFPAARYYVGSELNNDSSNHWGPNALAVVGMMEDLGFREITQQKLTNKSRMIFTGRV